MSARDALVKAGELRRKREFVERCAERLAGSSCYYADNPDEMKNLIRACAKIYDAIQKEIK